MAVRPANALPSKGANVVINDEACQSSPGCLIGAANPFAPHRP